MNELLLALQLLVLHRVDGRIVYINPVEITSVAETRDKDDPRKTVHPGARCIVYLSDQHFFAVTETCDRIRELLAK